MSKRPPLGKLSLASKRAVRVSFLIVSSVSAIAGICYPPLARILHLLLPVAAGQTHHPTTKGMLLALQALRRLVSTPMQIFFVRMV